MIKIYSRTMILFFLNPLIIAHNYEKKMEKIKSILRDSVSNEQGVDVDAIMGLLYEHDNLLNQYLSFVQTHLGIETVFQSGLQIILVLLAQTSSPTTGGGA